MNRKQLVDSAYNLAGSLAPMLATLVAIPLILKGIGNERFSALTLAWSFLGYLLLFDLGFSRATTRLVAISLSPQQDRNPERLRQIFWSSTWSLLLVSLVLCVLVIPTLPWLVSFLQHSNEQLAREILQASQILCLSLPFLTLTANLRGVLEAQGRFFSLNILQSSMGVGSVLIPLLFLNWERPLVAILTGIVLFRVLGCVAHFALVLHKLPELWVRRWLRWVDVKELWSFGGWITVSNVVGPLLFYFDRFVLGALIPMKNVGFYTAPMEMATKLWLIPASLTRVIFPSFSAMDPKLLKSSYRRALLLISLGMALPCIALIVLSKWILTLWLGPEYGEFASNCFQILLLGVWLNSLAWLPFTLLQSRAHTKSVALLHIAELIPYAIAFVLLTQSFGLEGAAWAWTLRMAVDAVILFVMAEFVFREK